MSLKNVTCAEFGAKSAFFLRNFANLENWRRERDSNPRNGFPFNGFQDRRLKPLGHLSARRTLFTGANHKCFSLPNHKRLSTPNAGAKRRPATYFAIFSSPPMNGRSASGITTDPSLCW